MTERPHQKGFEAIPVLTSRFRLDGGSMFGIVPRALWEQKAPADGRNRIQLCVNTLVVKTPGAVVLVEPGMGGKFDEKGRDIYALEEIDEAGALGRAGVSPADVDVVILTHLHLDHAGGATRRDPAGRLEVVFDRATFVVQDAEWDAAGAPMPFERGSYRPDDFQPLASGGRLSRVRGNVEIVPGVGVELTGGHTRGHQVVRLSWEGYEGVYLGDLVPTCAHLNLNWMMAWDLEPEAVYEAKARLLGDAAERGVMCFFPHDPRIAGCRIEAGGRGRYRVLEDTVIEAA